MAYFALPYSVSSVDHAPAGTDAAGTDTVRVGAKLQQLARRALLTQFAAAGDPAAAQTQLAAIVMSAREMYSRAFRPIAVGDRVAALLSIAAMTDKELVVCTRVVRDDGEPVFLGYETVGFATSSGAVDCPPVIERFALQELGLFEQLPSPVLSQHLPSADGVTVFFPSMLRGLGQAVAAAGWGEPRIVGRPAEVAVRASGPGDILFMMPGQGSFDAALLTALHETGEQDVLNSAESVVQAALGQSLRAFVSEDAAGQRRRLAACPDLDQFGTFLISTMVARRLIAAGKQPDAVMGHSFGEIAALCIAGSFDAATGLAIVAERVRALRNHGPRAGGMLAVAAGVDKVRHLLGEEGRHDLTISVINHAGQTVISGETDRLLAIQSFAAQRGLSATLLQSRYPFHSLCLSTAAREFSLAMRGLPIVAPRRPAFSPIAGGFYGPEADIRLSLASHLTRPVDFLSATATLGSLGSRVFIECGAGQTLSQLVRRNLGDAVLVTPAPLAAASLTADITAAVATWSDLPTAKAAPAIPPSLVETPSLPIPIAIVAMGCIVPGAADPTELWRNMLTGVSGVKHLRGKFPEIEADFGSPAGGPAIVPDKTYSLLSGGVDEVPRPEGLAFSDAEFVRLSRAQRMLAVALHQCGRSADGVRATCLLGSTADGVEEYDDALFCRNVKPMLDTLALPSAVSRATVAAAFASIPEYRGDHDPEALAPAPACRHVVARMLGSVDVVNLDAACASSLYALDLGMRQLRTGQTDQVYAGGVFSPGAANAALFAQFGGLSATQSRPFDVAADGVIFGEGAAILVLKRLEDAEAAGDRIHAVIRGVGLSSDGRSPSVNVPRAAGQSLAVVRAYEETAIDRSSIQVIEAHATATTVGDATEFQSLSEVFANVKDGGERILIGSVKALLGHTGWLAGAVSVIKMCLALAERTVPPQYNYAEPNGKIDLDGSPFAIPRAPMAWPQNGASPRRAAVNGFGFGGTNAHLILEEHQPGYHGRLGTAPTAPALDLVAVAIGTAFNTGLDDLSPIPGPRASTLKQSALRLPKGKRLMPDVTEQMDASQFLALAGAEAALTPSAGKPAIQRERIGVIIGVTAKARRGITATDRILADRFRRTFSAALASHGVATETAGEIAAEASRRLKGQSEPSNAYTLVGMMPNVVTGRVANMYDLMGPNMTVDAADRSLLEALRVAAQHLAGDSVDAVLAGALNATAPWPQDRAGFTEGSDVPDGVAMALITKCALAEELGLPIIAAITVGAVGEDTVLIQPATMPHGRAVEECRLAHRRPNEVVGVKELAQALHGKAMRLVWEPVQLGQAPVIEAPAAASETGGWSGIAGQDQPIHYFTPVQVRLPAAARGAARTPRHVAVVTDQPAAAAALRGHSAFVRARISVLAPAGAASSIEGSYPIDLTDDAALGTSLAAMPLGDCDLVLVVRDLARAPVDSLLRDDCQPIGLLEAAFATLRHVYQTGLQPGTTAAVALSTSAWPGGQLHPEAAMLAGLIKSVARELPTAVIHTIAAAGADFSAGLDAALAEWATPGPDVELALTVDGARAAIRLAPAPAHGKGTARLDAGSIVVASGGGRGITAVLAEGLIERFGCTVALLGRSDPATVPPHIQTMDEATFASYEGVFYRESLAKGPVKRMPELRRAYERLAAGRELCANLAKLRTIGRVEYHTVDIGDAAAVDAVLAGIGARHGRIDLVVHGAGVQLSKPLPRRRLEEFRATVSPKLGGLKHLYAACRAHSKVTTEFHILTSAFSAIGNDGQADYGAANEAMGALANALDAKGAGRWTALGWLAWAGVGMTRGSEYAALGLARGLRGVRPAEGKALFLPLIEGEPGAANAILLTEGEQRFYGLRMAPPAEAAAPKPARPPRLTPLATEGECAWTLDAQTAPYLAHHVVNDVPTLPGSFELEFVLQAARALRPQRLHVAADGFTFSRFVRVPEGRSLALRAHSRMVSEDADESVVHVQLLSDFHHRSGAVLQRDVVHFEAKVRLTDRIPSFGAVPATGEPDAGLLSADPYLSDDSPVRLSDLFDCLTEIRIGHALRTARFELRNTRLLRSMQNFITPCVLVDALTRLATVAPPGGRDDVFVPATGGTVQFAPGLNDAELARLGGSLRLIAATPRLEGEFLRGTWCRAIDEAGRTVVAIGGGSGRLMPAEATARAPVHA